MLKFTALVFLLFSISCDAQTITGGRFGNTVTENTWNSLQTFSGGMTFPLPSCVEGEILRDFSGFVSCNSSPSPTLTSCGSSPSLSPNSTDYQGVVTVGTGIVGTCTVTFGASHTSPALGCMTQTSGSSVASLPTVSTTGITQTFLLSLASGQFSYLCFPK